MIYMFYLILTKGAPFSVPLVLIFNHILLPCRGLEGDNCYLFEPFDQLI